MNHFNSSDDYYPQAVGEATPPPLCQPVPGAKAGFNPSAPRICPAQTLFFPGFPLLRPSFEAPRPRFPRHWKEDGNIVLGRVPALPSRSRGMIAFCLNVRGSGTSEGERRPLRSSRSASQRGEKRGKAAGLSRWNGRDSAALPGIPAHPSPSQHGEFTPCRALPGQG